MRYNFIFDVTSKSYGFDNRNLCMYLAVPSAYEMLLSRALHFYASNMHTQVVCNHVCNVLADCCSCSYSGKPPLTTTSKKISFVIAIVTTSFLCYVESYGSAYYASRRSRTRDTVKLTVCVCVSVFQL